MIEDSEFNFRAIDILAASEDHVFRAIHQVQESLFIKVANVPGVQPAINNRLGGGLWAVQIALNDGRTFDTNFSHLTYRKFLPVFVNDFAVKGGGQVAALDGRSTNTSPAI